jgi:hypothetical protein
MYNTVEMTTYKTEFGDIVKAVNNYEMMWLLGIFLMTKILMIFTTSEYAIYSNKYLQETPGPPFSVKEVLYDFLSIFVKSFSKE